MRTLYLATGMVLLVGAFALGLYLYHDAIGLSEEGNVGGWFYKENLLRTIGDMLFAIIVGAIGGAIIGYSLGVPSDDYS